MDDRIKSVIENHESIKLRKEEKRTKIDEFSSSLQSSLVEMEEAFLSLGMECTLSAFKIEVPGMKYTLSAKSDGERIYTVKLDEESQILSFGYGEREKLKNYFISIGNEVHLEKIDSNEYVELKDILMLDLKRLIKINNL